MDMRFSPDQQVYAMHHLSPFDIKSLNKMLNGYVKQNYAAIADVDTSPHSVWSASF